MKRYPVSRSLDKPIYEPQPYRANGAMQKSGGRTKQTHLRIVSNIIQLSHSICVNFTKLLAFNQMKFWLFPVQLWPFAGHRTSLITKSRSLVSKTHPRPSANFRNLRPRRAGNVAEVTCLRTSAEDNPAPSTINHAALHFFRILQHLYGKEFHPLSRSPLHLRLKAQNKTNRTSHSFPKQHVRKSKQKQQFHFGILWYGWILPSNRAFATVQRSSTAMQSPGRGSFWIPYPPVI